MELLEDEKHLLQILHQGSEKARTVAQGTIETTYKNLGVVL
jgi:tryptophanyl-tRNA synthetase